MRRLPKAEKIYLTLIYMVTILSIVMVVNNSVIDIKSINYNDVIIFIILIALTESFTVIVKSISFSTSFAVTIAAYILFGPMISIIIVTLGFLCRVLKIDNRGYRHIFNTPWFGTAFNCCALILPIIVGDFVYRNIGGVNGIDSVYDSLLQLIVFVFIYLIINNGIMSKLMALKIKKPFKFCFMGNIKIGLLNSVVMLPIGMLLAIVFIEYDYWQLLFAITAIVLIRYTLILYSNTKDQLTGTVEALMNAIDARDVYTQGHSRRVAEISVQIAQELKFNQFEIERLHMAAMLHDVGKIGIRDNILNKPGKLTEEEYNIIKSHPSIGATILKEIKNIDYVHKIVEHHHERYDGKGYPDGLAGDEIDKKIYIVQLADTIDAMLTDRPYRKGLSKAVVKAEIEKYSGTQFHPEVAKAYLRIMEREEKIALDQAKMAENSVSQ